MNWKGFGRKWSWPNFKVLSWHLPGGTEENHEKPQSGLLVSRPRFNPGPSEYEAGVLPLNHDVHSTHIKRGHRYKE
jgi:hypothetical protein